MSKYYYNKDFFQNIDTEEKAYWLGFLYADGCINRLYRNGKLVSMDLEIGLAKEDETHLSKFLNSIQSNVPIKSKTVSLNNRKYEAKRVTICCTKMCKDLCEKGCTPQKSLTLKFPDKSCVDNALLRHFIRGYFDGDGCVSISKKNVIQINFVGAFEILDGISNFLLEQEIIYKKPNFYKNGNAFEMYIYGADIIKGFYDFIYSGSLIYLDRKYHKFKIFFDTYNLKRKSQSGKQGVRLDTRTNKWCVTGCLNGRQIYLGSYKNKDDAIDIRKNFEINKCRLKQ